MKVLTVDDDPGVRELIGDFLRSRGYDVITADGGQAALEAMKREKPDLVILDLMMPGMTGMDVLRNVPDRSVPVIVVTAVTDEDVGQTALREGARDYVTKPIDLQYLERAVATVLLSRGE